MDRLLPEHLWSPTHRFVIGLEAMQRAVDERAIANVQTELDCIVLENQSIPITRNEREYDNSYVCSPYTAYVRYARDELGLIKQRSLQLALRGVIGVADIALRLARINQTVSLNNWLFSTNIVPDWQNDTIDYFTAKLAHANPQHSLSIRSLNTYSNAALIERLQAKGWLMLPARQVYLFPQEGDAGGDWWRKNNVKNDQRLLKNTQLQLVLPQAHQGDDFKAIERVFQQLFIDKHSAYNPQFSAAYFEFLHSHRLVEFFSFRDISGRIVASIGLFTQNGLITAPIVGYDTGLPKSLGLYRLLMAQLLKVTHERGLPLNLSSGAGHFKRQRGGVPFVEYTALYIDHLPWQQRWLQRGFAGLLNRFAPGFLQKYEL